MARTGRKTKLYIIDGSLTIRAMLATLVGREEDFEICGMAANARKALHDISIVLPDIILLDPSHSGMEGAAFLDAVSYHWRPMHVIVVSMSAKPGSIACSKAFNWGATACFDKAQLINNWREFFDLLDEVHAETGILSVLEPSAVSLPAVFEEAA